MLKNVIVPTLGLDMESATIQQWLKREGDWVEKDEPLLLVETDKASTEILAPATGRLRQIVYPEGATVPVTRTIALIETAEAPHLRLPLGEGRGEGLSPFPPEEKRGEGLPSLPSAETWSGPAPDLPAVRSRAPEPSPADHAGLLRASPAARRLAREMGIDLSLVVGTGPRGRIQGEDVRRFAEKTKPVTGQAAASAGLTPEAAPVPIADRLPAHSGLPGRLVPLSRKRRLTAERMALSARSVARLVLNMEVDVAELVRLRGRLQPEYQAQGIRLSYDAILTKAVGTALAEHPYLNARWTEQGIYLTEPVNVGVAVALEDGLVVPVIHEANRKTLAETAAELNRLLEKARQDRLTMDEITGGTFTITNLGMFGVDSFIPIVNPPETAILGVGRIAEKPVGRDGQIVLRPTMALTLSVDHRVVDGAPAARFMQRVKQLLEDPYRLA